MDRTHAQLTCKPAIKAAFFFILALLMYHPASAQKFEINAVNCHMSSDDVAMLNRIGQFEARFYNVVFNTGINDSAKVKVNLYGKKSEYEQVQKDAINTTFIDGFYSGPQNQVFLYKGTDYMKVLLHETSHNLLRYNLPYPPTWLNEGIATLFGYLVIKDNDIYYAKQTGYIKLVKDQMAMTTFNLHTYFNYNSTDWYNKDKREYVYSVAYCLVYFFVKDDIENLQHMLVLMKAGYNTPAAITKVFGSFEQFEKRFKDFYKPEVGYRL